MYEVLRMRIVITGAGGVLGQMLVRRLIDHQGLSTDSGGASVLTELILLDQEFPANAVEDPRVRRVDGQITERTVLQRAFTGGADAVFHLAAVVSAGAEADFDLGMRVNLDGLRAVLGACRQLGTRPRVVFTSSVAAFGGDLPAVVLDSTAATPQSSYGTQKVIGELLVADMTRKAFIDGRTLRLPTIVVRPGKPNRAASGFMSSILREPLNGEHAVCPVAPEARMWILSPERAVDALIRAMELSSEAWGWNRTINAPGITVRVAEALDALAQISGAETAKLVRFEHDPAIERIVLGWPARFETDRANRLGFRSDTGIEAIIRAHLRALGH
jgi:nucleoside-diphosphate-sugar epimerase